MRNSLARRIAAEYLGTAFLVAAVVGSGIMGERLAGGNVALALLANTIATGAALVALILAFGPISGAHLNPVVTLSDALEKGLPWKETSLYISGQVLGGVSGTMVAHLMFGLPVVSLSRHARSGGSQIFSEFIATFGPSFGDLGIFAPPREHRPICRRSLYRRGLLVYRIDLLCESRRDDRPIVDRHLFWHSPHRCFSLCARGDSRSIGRNISLPLADPWPAATLAAAQHLQKSPHIFASNTICNLW